MWNFVLLLWLHIGQEKKLLSVQVSSVNKRKSCYDNSKFMWDFYHWDIVWTFCYFNTLTVEGIYQGHIKEIMFVMKNPMWMGCLTPPLHEGTGKEQRKWRIIADWQKIENISFIWAKNCYSWNLVLQLKLSFVFDLMTVFYFFSAATTFFFTLVKIIFV